MKPVLSGVLGVMLAGTLLLGAPLAQGAAAPGGLRAADGLDPNISMTVRFDYDDRVRMDHPIPAFIEIENRGPDVDAVVRLTLDSDPPCAYEQAVRLDADRTRVTLPFYALGNVQNIEVALLQGGAKVAVAEKSRTVGYTTGKLVGILSTNPDGMAAYHAYLDELQGDATPVDVTPVDLTAADFPRQTFLLDRFALVVLNHFDLSLLDEAQEAALTQWVKNGGRLLVDADAGNVQALRSLRPILALEAAGSFTEPDAVELLGGLAARSYPWDKPLQSLGKVTPAGAVVAGSSARPLISEYAAGSGRVFVTAFALDDAFFQQTRAAELFTEIPGLSTWSETGTGSTLVSSDGYNISALGDAVGSIEWLDAPSLGWIVLVLLGFIALAGPVAYIVLARLDKRDWIWVTTPGLAVVFCALIMVFGIGGHGNQTVASVVSVIDSRAGVGAAQAWSMVGVGAPRQGSYTVKLEEDAIPLQAQYNGYALYNASTSGRGAAGEPAVVFDMDGYPEAAFQSIRQWSMDSMLVRRDLPMAGALEAQVLYGADGKAYYQVQNNTGADLEEVTILSHLGYCQLPLLAAGEERTGVLNGYTTSYYRGNFTTNGAYLVAGIGYGDMYDAFREGTGYTFSSEAEQREAYLRSRVESALIRYTSTVSAVSTAQYLLPDSALVYGWSSQLGALPLTVNGKAPQNALNRTMVISTAGVEYEDLELMALPVASVVGTITEAKDVLEGYCEPGESMAYFTGGEVTFGFGLPGNLSRYALESLSIMPDYIYGEYEASLYNTATGDWDPYVLGDALEGEALADYIDADYTVLLKVAYLEGGGEVYLESPLLSLVGKETDDG